MRRLNLAIGVTLVLVAAIACTCPAPTVEPTAESPTLKPGEGMTVEPTVSSTEELTPTEVPTPTGPSLGDTRTRPADGMVMVYVPAGEFTMGSTDDEVDDALALCNEYRGDCERDRFAREQPAHAVALDGFWIDRTEVTNAQFAAFLNEEGNREEEGVTWLALEREDCLIERTGGEFRPKSGYGDHPVVKVSWYGAAAYCEWAGGRLPTEAQWEYAARGSQGYIFPWGDELDGTRLNYCDANCEFGDAYESFDDGYARSAPVGSYPDGASWVGAFDLAGNVWEWGGDWYGEYPSGRQENPSGPSTGDGYRVVRGGGWSDFWFDARAASRYGVHHGYPGGRYDGFGFRCVVSPAE
jgi:formylglycine-generating enzyme required for sulfatase activity